MRLRSGDKHHLRKSSDRKAQIRKAFVPLTGLICAFRSEDFLRWCLAPERNLTHNLIFLFPIVFGIIIFYSNLCSSLGVQEVPSIFLIFFQEILLVCLKEGLNILPLLQQSASPCWCRRWSESPASSIVSRARFASELVTELELSYP